MTDGPAARGRLIALEGIDGSGKSTQAGLLAESLGALATHEPGGTQLGRALRAMVLETSLVPVPRAEALMLLADRAQHVTEVIEPALAAGRWVVSDRFSGSTLAYQGWGRELGANGLRKVAGWASGGLWPDLSLLIDVPLPEARRRLDPARADRMEALDPAFHQRVRDGYLALASTDQRWVVVDGTGPVEQVAAVLSSAVRDRLGRP